MNADLIPISTVYLAMTRPPTMFGVTFSWAILEGLGTVLLFLGSGSLLAFIALPLLHIPGLIAARTDAHLIEIVAVWAQRCSGVRSRRYWHLNSYAG